MKTLKETRIDETVRVVKLHGEGAVKRRIMDMGLTKGVEVSVRKVAPLGDPIEVNLRGYELSIRKADADMKRLYNTVLEAQLAGLEAVKPGADCAGCDKVARDIIDNAGYKGCFGHSLGHGVGMYIHEEPRLSSRATGKLEPGHIVTVEPGIYIEGKYGCRIEDMVAITENGSYDFTHSPKELIELF